MGNIPRLYQTSISPLRVRTSMMVWPRKSSDSRLKCCFTRDLMSSSSSHTRTLMRSVALWHSLQRGRWLCQVRTMTTTTSTAETYSRTAHQVGVFSGAQCTVNILLRECVYLCTLVCMCECARRVSAWKAELYQDTAWPLLCISLTPNSCWNRQRRAECFSTMTVAFIARIIYLWKLYVHLFGPPCISAADRRLAIMTLLNRKRWPNHLASDGGQTVRLWN